jgi:hypothetical protein
MARLGLEIALAIFFLLFPFFGIADLALIFFLLYAAFFVGFCVACMMLGLGQTLAAYWNSS